MEFTTRLMPTACSPYWGSLRDSERTSDMFSELSSLNMIRAVEEVWLEGEARTKIVSQAEKKSI